jgi:NADPH:quinone reductase-like Zn-dependent oxidoreductase
LRKSIRPPHPVYRRHLPHPHHRGDPVRKDIWGAVDSRKLQLPIDRVFAFDDIGKAFEHMEANKHLGKIVVTL